MDKDILRIVGQIAGIGGLGMGVSLIIFKEIIRKNIFPRLKTDQAYSLLRLISILSWSIAIVGIAAWTFTSASKTDTSKINVPKFSTAVTNQAHGEALETFVDRNRGKIIQINTEIDPLYSRIDKVDENDDLFVATEPCADSLSTLECAGFHFIVKGQDHILEYYKGNHRLNGYFVIYENVWMHQGIYYILKSISREQVLLQTQRAQK